MANGRGEVREGMEQTVFKTELVRRVARETKLPQPVVSRALTAGLGAIQAALARGERVVVPGFGVFATSQRRAGRVRSVRDGRPVAVPARRVAVFRAGAVLKRAVTGTRRRRRRLFGLGSA